MREGRGVRPGWARRAWRGYDYKGIEAAFARTAEDYGGDWRERCSIRARRGSHFGGRRVVHTAFGAKVRLCSIVL